jgi:murein DD-endopeptidase MepM/ murein hydrolase activator NlpD
VRRFALLLVLVSLALVSLGAEPAPWRARRRPDLLPNRLASERVRIEDWAPEPESPAQIDREAFTRALAELCLFPSPARARDLAGFTLAAGAEFAIDPFLLAALTYRASRCRGNKQELGGVGLTLLPPRMYEGDLRKRSYHYRVREGAGYSERERALPRHAFVPGNLLRAESNLYFAAGLLSVWRDQHDTVDGAFEQAPHRHFVSHWVWGDRVRSARAEDRILGDRRRLLGYYGVLPPRAPIRHRGLPLGAPLDGAPRVVSSGLGFARDGGRSHRGIDVESEFGEPVRAIAAGKVVFSGVDLPGQRQHLQLPATQTNAYDRRALGHGGRYLCIAHGGEGEGLRSCYMHLETVERQYGQSVERGQRIGSVGRTGMQRSSPHLHLELFSGLLLLDPLVVLRGHLIGTPVQFEDLAGQADVAQGGGGGGAF